EEQDPEQPGPARGPREFQEHGCRRDYALPWIRGSGELDSRRASSAQRPAPARPRRREVRATLRERMAYVITQPCIGIKDASCVEVCPVDCIHTNDAADMYYIDPDECIDCGACVDPCPVDAIFPEDEVPEQWRNFITINADYFKNRQ